MIHIFRIFDQPGCDYLEFQDRETLMKEYNKKKDEDKYNWTIVTTRQALSEETRLTQHQSLRTMQDIGDLRVVKVIVRGDVQWFSPSQGHGIPSEYQIAIKHFTDQCKFYKVTQQHHEVFAILKDQRFKRLHKEIIDRILSRVRDSRCPVRLNKYLDLNLKKLPDYGVQIERIEGTYIDIRNTLSQHQPSCPLFGEFMHQLLDICIEKEQELVGHHQTHQKRIMRA